MPAVSEKQRRAMWAAAEGRSNLGIPKSVGEEFVRHDESGKPELGDLTDREAAEAIRDGDLPSPTQYGDFWLFALRITGTGMAWRDQLKEWAFRDPEQWLSDEFVDRCNGLPVIFEHPEKAGLSSDEFRERAIGTIVLPYRQGDAVWGIAKIFDADAAQLMQTTHRSTSPGVKPPEGAKATPLENGAQVLDEGLPRILDHLAVCTAGVWDKDGSPDGVRLDAKVDSSLIGKGEVVTDEEREALEKERDDARRERDDARRDLEDARKKRHDADERDLDDKRRDEKRKDAEESERAAIERAEKEKADAKRLDEKRADAKRADRKKRHDFEKHAGGFDDCARCDESEREEGHKAEEELEREDRKRHDKSRKDGAPEEKVEANVEEEIKDSRIARLEAELAKIKAGQAPLSMSDANAVAAAFHRGDSLYSMLGERTPQVLPGEGPLAYRRRLADGLRKFTRTFREHAIHDSLSGPPFDLTENAIYAEALEEAKNPTINDSAGRLTERVTTSNGKTRVEFYGDARVAWEPFMPQRSLRIAKFTRPNQGFQG